MFLFNLTLGQFLVLFGSASAFLVALYLLDRSRRRQMVSTLRFWIAAEQPPQVRRRKKIQQPWSLLLQLASIGLLLLAIAQLRWGSRESAPRDHIIVLDTSAWMGARLNNRTLLEEAKDRARAYMKVLPSADRVMLVRADALATPATPFERDRRVVERALNESAPGSTALNLDQALTFARGVQAQGGRRAGEIVYIGPGRVSERDPGDQSVQAANLRFLPVTDPAENCGLRKIGLRRSEADAGIWEITVAVRNYGKQPKNLNVGLAFGPSESGAGNVPVGSRQVAVPPGGEKELSFEFRTRAAGLLDARLYPNDAFPADNRAVLELPAHRNISVVVFSDAPELLRPALAANSRVTATFLRAAEYRDVPGADLVVLDRFKPPQRPRVPSIWIDPPADASPIPVRSRQENAQFTHWLASHSLGAGLRTRDLKLESASILEAAPADVRIGETDKGPVIVARPAPVKTVVLGFHPALSAMRYELATPLLFANILHWMSPEIFRRREMSGSSAGTIAAVLDSEVKAADVKVTREDGSPVPFTIHGRAVRFYAGHPGTVRLETGDRESVYSLTLPEMWEATWDPPLGVRRGLPRLSALPGGARDLWPWLALAGAAGLLAEWYLYGRFRRAAMRLQRPAAFSARKAS